METGSVILIWACVFIGLVIVGMVIEHINRKAVEKRIREIDECLEEWREWFDEYEKREE